MKRTLILAQAIAIIAVSPHLFASYQNQDTVTAPIQRIDIVNLLWNENATNAVPGLSPTSVLVAFNNGSTKPCFTTTLAFQGAATVLAGSGQACVAAVTSVTITPVAGPAGTVYAAPADTSINGAYYATQMIINDKTDPVFDSTNGAVKTQGTVQVSSQGQYKS
jgi:hypothetical protein